MSYDCSYDFKNKKKRKQYRYVVIQDGDLDFNNAILLRSIDDIKKCFHGREYEIQAIIRIDRFVEMIE